MTHLVKGRSQKAGLDPGTPIYIGEAKETKVKATIIDYHQKDYLQKEVQTVKECLPYIGKPTTTWLNIDGIHNVSLIEEIGKCFNLHPLILEDVVNTGQRPKIEDYQDYLFVVLKMLGFDNQKNKIKINVEQVSLVLGPNFVISFQEKEGDVFDSVRERLKNEKSRLRKEGTDYLAYSLIDAIVDSYFAILEKLGDKIEDVEEVSATNPTPRTMETIHILKREMIFLRKSIWPLREVIGVLERGESPLVKKTTRIYLRDVYDHTVQVIETIETFRDILSGLLDVYLSSLSNKMNEVMKVLTIIATIFIPLTFIAGVYGMNFRFMPELRWYLGYPLVLLVMLIVAVSMVIYFKRRKWL